MIDRLAEAGCAPICCPCEAVVGRVSLKVQELRIECETKTKDNVFITLFISVQYQAIRDKVCVKNLRLIYFMQLKQYRYRFIKHFIHCQTINNK